MIDFDYRGLLVWFVGSLVAFVGWMIRLGNKVASLEAGQCQAKQERTALEVRIRSTELDLTDHRMFRARLEEQLKQLFAAQKEVLQELRDLRNELGGRHQ